MCRYNLWRSISSILSSHQMNGGCCATGGFHTLLWFGSLHCLFLTFQLCQIISFILLSVNIVEKNYFLREQLPYSCVAAVCFCSRHFKIQAQGSWWIKIKAGLCAEVSNLNEMTLQSWAQAPIRVVSGRQCTISIVTQIDLFMCMKEHVQESNVKIKIKRNCNPVTPSFCNSIHRHEAWLSGMLKR